VKCVLNLNSAIPPTVSCTNQQIFQEPITKCQAMSLVLVSCITQGDVLPKVVREMGLTTIYLEHPVGETCRFNEAELEMFLASFQARRNG